MDVIRNSSNRVNKPVMLIWEESHQEIDLDVDDFSSRLTMYWISQVCDAWAEILYEAHGDYIEVVDGKWPDFSKGGTGVSRYVWDVKNLLDGRSKLEHKKPKIQLMKSETGIIVPYCLGPEEKVTLGNTGETHIVSRLIEHETTLCRIIYK